MRLPPDATESVYTTGFTNFVTWAESQDEFARNVSEVLEKYGWQLLTIEKVSPIDPRCTYSEEIEEIIERARDNPRACIFGTFHTYPVN
jgi:hypothetical protein